ncbi:MULTISPECIES: DegT/DnrJ/EryC1/StrS family aminotransferase [Ralstonia solanacearum species complex]|uniref:Uncharacterized protein n=6 Tax=Ralstonia solanacearum species complex TaxID=3116862 RepID=A0ABF7REB8_RALSL|nr:aminotransferase class I/II-fold pyridoxal phosphate-dependent enzyme [Ralstonia solanacearum]ALF87535.1 GDP-perosamine synthase [Ralstonia solanacearum]ATI27049.1 DegT/DnrJ/EryC1/StrS aminotransferase [Ralstonia solanacearum]ATJ85816.1 DegT/DnrJ/EryC1/StrS aminotransferase [Ralstonia solanacearum]EAP70791.1 Hypothetical Protein RRSL_00312 [Ralstonia solanacearum UW551]KEI31216.1 DegT/DnrJ/EryC1/StrS aminotransferase [Ralstonia solanacearum]
MSKELPEVPLALDGGRKTRTQEWPTYDKGYVDLGRGDEIAALRAIESRRLFRYDSRPHGETEVAQLERELAEFFDARYVLACSSGTTAIALALLGLGIKRGDRVACPAFTFAATPSAIILAGGIPVVIEVDENLHMDPADLEAKLTPDIKAVVAVHMRGFGCDIDRLVSIADAHGIPLVEDSVPALGVSIGGERKLGTIGRAGAFSMQSDKSINTGEGGFLVTSDRSVFERAVVLSGAYEQQLHRHTAPSLPTISDLTLPIFSFRLDEIRGAMARHQLAGLARRVATFQENYDYVASRISDLEPISLRQPVAERAYLGESLIFRLPDATAQQVSWFVQALNAEGIGCRALGGDARPNVRCFWNWRFAFPEMTEEETIARYKKSATFLKEAIYVPMSITLTEDDCVELVAAITKVCHAYSRLTAVAQPLLETVNG